MENKLNLVKTILNSIVQRQKALEKLDLNAKGSFEQLINMQDQLKALQNASNQEKERMAEIDDIAELQMQIEKEKITKDLLENNEEYFATIQKIEESCINLNKIVLDQKQPSSKAGQLCLIIERLKQLIEQLKKQLVLRQDQTQTGNLRYNLLNYLYRPAVEDFSQFLEELVLF